VSPGRPGRSTSSAGAAWTDREALRQQYASPAGLATRVGLYRYLVDDSALAGTTWEDWVLDHADWSGAGAAVALDVGCGAGAYEAGLTRRARTVVGLDLSPGMLVRPDGRVGRRAGLGVADAQELPVRDGSVDVLLAAHMLYHVPDIGRALAEARRALRPGGTALLVANGADDKRELRELWSEVAVEVHGDDASVWAWTGRFDVETGRDAVAAVFGDTEVDVLRGEFRFPSPEPVLAWVESLRAGTGPAFGLDAWDAVTAELRRRLTDHIDRHGHFSARKSSGVITAH
jgi:SAM-dependent methyltransferase